MTEPKTFQSNSLIKALDGSVIGERSTFNGSVPRLKAREIVTRVKPLTTSHLL